MFCEREERRLQRTGVARLLKSTILRTFALQTSTAKKTFVSEEVTTFDRLLGEAFCVNLIVFSSCRETPPTICLLAFQRVSVLVSHALGKTASRRRLDLRLREARSSCRLSAAAQLPRSGEYHESDRMPSVDPHHPFYPGRRAPLRL